MNNRPLIDSAVAFIREKSTQNAEGISLARFFWPAEEKWEPAEAEWDDIGDYHTFVAWFGVEFKEPAAVEWVKQQIQSWYSHFRQPNGMMISLWSPGMKLPTPSLWNSLSFYGHPGGRNFTKYVGGARKFLIALDRIQQGVTFRKDPYLHSLTRDR